MPMYQVEMALEIDAATPEDAALEAEATIADPARGGFVWDVRDLDGDETVSIDAERLFEPAPAVIPGQTTF